MDDVDLLRTDTEVYLPPQTANGDGMMVSHSLMVLVERDKPLEVSILRAGSTTVLTHSHDNSEGGLRTAIELMRVDILNLIRDEGKPQGCVAVAVQFNYYPGGSELSLSFMIVADFNATFDFELRSWVKRPGAAGFTTVTTWQQYRATAWYRPLGASMGRIYFSYSAYGDHIIASGLGASIFAGGAKSNASFRAGGLGRVGMVSYMQTALAAGVLPLGELSYAYMGDEGLTHSYSVGTGTFNEAVSWLNGITTTPVVPVIIPVTPVEVPPLLVEPLPVTIPATDTELKEQIARILTSVNALTEQMRVGFWYGSKTADLGIINSNVNATYNATRTVNTSVGNVGDAVVAGNEASVPISKTQRLIESAAIAMVMGTILK